MAFPKSGSLLESRINSGLSTQITIQVGGTTVGAIQSLQIKQDREMAIWEEIGTDGIIEIHPKGAAKINADVTRIVFDQLRLTEAFNRGFINLQAERFPFNVEIFDQSVALFNGDAIVHTLHNCWFSAYTTTINVSDFIITESASLKCERITTMRNGMSAVQGGIRGIRYEYDTIERSTDVNGQRGRIDSSGSQVMVQ